VSIPYFTHRFATLNAFPPEPELCQDRPLWMSICSGTTAQNTSRERRTCGSTNKWKDVCRGGWGEAWVIAECQAADSCWIQRWRASWRCEGSLFFLSHLSGPEAPGSAQSQSGIHAHVGYLALFFTLHFLPCTFVLFYNTNLKYS